MNIELLQIDTKHNYKILKFYCIIFPPKVFKLIEIEKLLVHFTQCLRVNNISNVGILLYIIMSEYLVTHNQNIVGGCVTV